jgi:hypothetical protein
MRGSLERARSELAERLRARRGEIEEALLTRTYAIADPKEAADPEYAQGLRAAVSAALDFGLSAVEHGEERSPQVPVLLLAQARLAARNNIPLDTVLRRYFAGYTTLGDFIVQEAGAADLKESWLKRLLREQAALFDRFLAAIGEEHGRESRDRVETSDRRRAERIERLLSGELLDTFDFGYDFDCWHVGVIAVGQDVTPSLRDLAKVLDRALLLIRPGGEAVWAWLGGRRALHPEELRSCIASNWPDDICLAVGESYKDVGGWRLSHRQARATLPVALGNSESVTHYGDVPLLAAVHQDDLLAMSLHKLFIVPIERERDGGSVALETLRAYFEAGRNAASAAAALGVSRQAVNGRLRIIEDRLGRSMGSCAPELEIALRAKELDSRPVHASFSRLA